MPDPIVWKTVWITAWAPPGPKHALYLRTEDPGGRHYFEVPWGQPEHAGVVIAAPDALSAELMLASLVAPELVVAYANIQRREPSLN